MPAKKSPTASGSKSAAIAAQVAKWTPQQRIADWKKNGVKGLAFKAWFGDWQNDRQNASKVVDEAGNPKDTDHLKIVYHGTRSSFTHFEKRPTDLGVEVGSGFYFAEDKAMAKEYANMAWKGGKGRIIACYLSIKKPFDFDKQISEQDLNAILAAAAQQDPGAAKNMARSFRKLTHNGSAHGGSIWWEMRKHLQAKLEPWDTSDGGVNEILGAAGFDGVGYTSKDEMGTAVFRPKETGEFGRVWIAFSPEQIKSVDNRGTFDPKNPKIRESLDAEDDDQWPFVSEEWTPYQGDLGGKGWVDPTTGEVRERDASQVDGPAGTIEIRVRRPDGRIVAESVPAQPTRLLGLVVCGQPEGDLVTLTHRASGCALGPAFSPARIEDMVNELEKLDLDWTQEPAALMRSLTPAVRERIAELLVEAMSASERQDGDTLLV